MFLYKYVNYVYMYNFYFIIIFCITVLKYVYKVYHNM